MKKSSIKTLAQFKDEHYGKVGTPKRDQLETGYQAFKTPLPEIPLHLGLQAGDEWQPLTMLIFSFGLQYIS